MNKLVYFNIYNRFLGGIIRRTHPLIGTTVRCCSNQNAIVTEEQIKTTLEKQFSSPQTIIQVEDISGGCGSMFNIYVESGDFKGLSIPKQHKIVYALLKEQIKNIHGLHLETGVPR